MDEEENQIFIDVLDRNWEIIGDVHYDEEDYLVFDGNSYIQTEITLGGRDFTVDCWVNTENSNVNDNAYFITIENPVNGYNLLSVRPPRRGAGYTYMGFINESAGVTSSTTKGANSSPFIYGLHHIAAVYSYNNQTFKFFVDGQQIQYYTGTIPKFGRRKFILKIGCADSTETTYFKGLVKNFRLYDDKALWSDNFTPPWDEYYEFPILCDLVFDIETTIKNDKEIWRYENYGTAEKLSVEGISYTGLNGAQSYYNCAFNHTVQEPCFDLPNTKEIWIKFDVFLTSTSSNRWRCYDFRKQSTDYSGVTSNGTSVQIWQNGCLMDEATNVITANRIQTVWIHMRSDGNDGIIECYLDGEKKVEYTGYVNDELEYSHIMLQSEGTNYFSNVIISNAEIEKNAVVKFTGEIEFDADIQVIAENDVYAESKKIIELKFDDENDPYKDECGNIWNNNKSPGLYDTTNPKNTFDDFNKSLSVSGGQYLVTANPIALGGQDFTIEFYAYANSSQTSWACFFSFGTNGNNSIFFARRNDYSGLRLEFYNKGTLDISDLTYIGVYQHYAFVYFHETKKVDIYINGILKYSLTLSSQFTQIEKYMYIGRTAYGSSQYFNGYIDNFKVYNCAKYVRNFEIKLPMRYYFDIECNIIMSHKSPSFLDKLIVHLPFDDETEPERDLCGNTWINYNNTGLTSGIHAFSRAMFFNSKETTYYAGKYLKLDGSITLGGRDFTIEFWIYGDESVTQDYTKLFTMFNNFNTNDQTLISFFVNSSRSYGLKKVSFGTYTKNVELNDKFIDKTFNHVIISYNHAQSSLIIFINSTLAATMTDFNLQRTVFNHFQIAKSNYSARDTDYGYFILDDFRIYDDLAIVDNNVISFDPPIAPNKIISNIEYETVIDSEVIIKNQKIVNENTVALLHFDDENDPYKDECNNIWNPYGAPTVSNSTVFAGDELNLDGTSSLKLSTGLTLGGQDFTIDGWAKMNISDAAWKGIFALNGNKLRIIQYNKETSNFEIGINGSVFKVFTETPLTDLFHFAMVYDNTNKKVNIYFNGKLISSTTFTITRTTFANVFIGGNGDNISTGASNWNGTIDEFRIVDGIMVYNAEFDPEEEYKHLYVINVEKDFDIEVNISKTMDYYFDIEAEITRSFDIPSVWLSFDEDYDIDNMDHQVTGYGSPEVVDSEDFISGKALLLDGKSYIRTQEVELGEHNFTIEGFIQTSADCPYDASVFNVYLPESEIPFIQLRHPNETEGWRIFVNTTNDISENNMIYIDTEFDPGTDIHFFAVLYDYNKQKLMFTVDGEIKATLYYLPKFIRQKFNIDIGARKLDNGEYIFYKGEIADFSVYDGITLLIEGHMEPPTKETRETVKSLVYEKHEFYGGEYPSNHGTVHTYSVSSSVSKTEHAMTGEKIKIVDVVEAINIWIKFDVYTGVGQTWYVYNENDNGINGIISKNDLSIDTYANDVIVNNHSDLVKEEIRKSVLLHMKSNETNGLVEAWYGSDLIYKYTGNVNNGDYFENLYIGADGEETLFSNLIISKTRLYVDEDVTPVGFETNFDFDIETTIKNIVIVDFDTEALIGNTIEFYTDIVIRIKNFVEVMFDIERKIKNASATNMDVIIAKMEKMKSIYKKWNTAIQLYYENLCEHLNGYTIDTLKINLNYKTRANNRSEITLPNLQEDFNGTRYLFIFNNDRFRNTELPYKFWLDGRRYIPDKIYKEGGFEYLYIPYELFKNTGSILDIEVSNSKKYSESFTFQIPETELFFEMGEEEIPVIDLFIYDNEGNYIDKNKYKFEILTDKNLDLNPTNLSYFKIKNKYLSFVIPLDTTLIGKRCTLEFNEKPIQFEIIGSEVTDNNLNCKGQIKNIKLNDDCIRVFKNGLILSPEKFTVEKPTNYNSIWKITPEEINPNDTYQVDFIPEGYNLVYSSEQTLTTKIISLTGYIDKPYSIRYYDIYVNGLRLIKEQITKISDFTLLLSVKETINSVYVFEKNTTANRLYLLSENDEKQFLAERIYEYDENFKNQLSDM